MQKWIKLIAAVMALCLAICITGCDKETGSSDSDSSGISDENNLPARKVGYIFNGDASKFNFTSQLCEQRTKAANRCSMETCYIDKVAVSDFEEAVKKLAAEGCTDIVTCNAVFANVLSSVSGKYMNINFIGYGTRRASGNVAPYTEQIYQGAYVAGMVAAYNSDTKKIGFIGDRDLIYVNPTVNAATLGMQLVYTDAVMYGAGATKDDEIDKALQELLAKGCDVIICYTSSSYAENYCEQHGIKFITSLDFSEIEDEYSNMLMYFYCKRDSYFLAQFKQMQMNTWIPEDYVGTVANGIVNISAAQPAAKPDTQKIMNTLISKLSGGGEIFVGQLDDNTGRVRYVQNDIMTDEEVYAMEWFVKGVEVVGNFRNAQTNLPKNPLDVKT